MTEQASKAPRREGQGRNVGDQEKEEEESFRNGPFSVLHSAVHSNEKILVCCRNDKKLLGQLRAFDRHFNLILEGVHEAWTEQRKGSEPELKSRFIDKLFLRGDSVILVTKISQDE